MPEQYEIDYTITFPENQEATAGSLDRTISDEIQFSETPIVVSLSLTQDEFTKMFSSLMNGAWLTYPDEYEQIISKFWLEMVEGGSMSCEDVADCIETSSAVLDALLQQMAANGFAPSGNNSSSTDVTLSPSKSAENLLSSEMSCTDPQLMATARAVIQQIHEAAIDFFESVEFVTNPIEAANIVTDGVPVAGTVNNITELADWLIQTMRESYEASYNQEVENELACDLFCRMREDCELSYNMLLDMYESYASASYGLPTNVDDFQSIVDWATGLSLTISTGTVATFHYMLVLAMKFGGGTVFEFAGLAGLSNIINSTIGYQDYTFNECECATETPTNYWMIYQDFSLGLGAFELNGSAAGTLVAGGVQSVTSGTINVYNLKIQDLGATFGGLACIVEEQARGHAGHGSNDRRRVSMWSNVGASGTEALLYTEGFITCNQNSCGGGSNNTGVTANGRSLSILGVCSGTLLYPTRFMVLRKIAIYGACNPGQVKPPQAVYVTSIPNPVAFP